MVHAVSAAQMCMWACMQAMERFLLAIILTGVRAAGAGQWQAQAIEEGPANCGWSRRCSFTAAGGWHDLQVSAWTMQTSCCHQFSVSSAQTIPVAQLSKAAISKTSASATLSASNSPVTRVSRQEHALLGQVWLQVCVLRRMLVGAGTAR